MPQSNLYSRDESDERSPRAKMSSLKNLKLVCAQVMTTATGLS
jgi:hypothetical protein